MNPWLSIWFKPRQTIRQIVETNSKRQVVLLAMAGGAANWVAWSGLWTSGPLALLLAFITFGPVGAVVGWICLYVFSWLYRSVGACFGGKAKNVEVRAAIAWAQVPTICICVSWVIVAMVLLQVLGSTGVGDTSLPSKLLWNFWGGALGNRLWDFWELLLELPRWMLAVVWVLQGVFTAYMLAEVHRFSRWRGFGTWALVAFVLFSGPVLAWSWFDWDSPFAPPGRQAHGPHPDRVHALGNLETLEGALQSYHGHYRSYPDNWLEDMYPKTNYGYGPLFFDFDIQSGAEADIPYSSHNYRYTPMPVGCQEPNCTGYTLAALPKGVLRDGRSYFTDESGMVHHCLGTTGADWTDVLAMAGSVNPKYGVFSYRRPRPCKPHP